MRSKEKRDGSAGETSGGVWLAEESRRRCSWSRW